MRFLINLSLFCFTSLFSLQAQVLKSTSGYVEFLSEASVESFVGKSNFLHGELNLADSTLDFYLDLSTLSTGIKLRDEHMRENHLETEKFPFAEFSGKLMGFDAAKKDTQMVTAKGDFSIHGVTKSIEVVGKVVYKGNQLEIVAKWGIRLDDYAIPRPQFLFLKLSEEQKVSININLKSE